MSFLDDERVYYENLEGEKRKIQKIENEMKSKPREKDYKAMLSVLKDFGLVMKRDEVPEFDTLFQLERWKANRLKEWLR